MRRIAVVGTSGSGKSTFSARLAAALDVPVVELDALYHQPGWTPRDQTDLRDAVGRVVASDRWVIDGNYSMVRDLVWGAADTVVWLDFRRWFVMSRVLSRTLPRVLWRRPLWNGNYEDWRFLLNRDPGNNIVLWSWTTYERNRANYLSLMADERWERIRFLQLRTPTEASQLIARLAGTGVTRP